MAELKIGRNFFDITEKDVVLFNGACWQLLSQTIFSGWHNVFPTMSKSICQKFVKNNILIMFKKTDEYVASNGQQMGMYYYKFDIEKLNEYLSKN